MYGQKKCTDKKKCDFHFYRKIHINFNFKISLMIVSGFSLKEKMYFIFSVKFTYILFFSFKGQKKMYRTKKKCHFHFKIQVQDRRVVWTKKNAPSML